MAVVTKFSVLLVTHGWALLRGTSHCSDAAALTQRFAVMTHTCKLQTECQVQKHGDISLVRHGNAAEKQQQIYDAYLIFDAKARWWIIVLDTL